MAASQHTVAIQQVHSILLGAGHAGLDGNALLARAGIAPALLDSPLARVSQRQFALLMRCLRRALRDEFWALLSCPVPPGSFARCMHQAVRCPTLGDALREAFTFYHLLLADFVPRLTVVEGRAHIQLRRLREHDPRLDYALRAFMLFTFNVGSWLVARRIPLSGVEYTEASSSAETSRVYQVPVVAGQAHMGLTFDARWLHLPVVQSVQSLREFLAGAPANMIVRYRDSGSVTERTRRLLLKSLGGELPSLEEVGEALAVTPQTLRRRLRDEGRGFQELKDEIRRDAAIELLLHTERPLLDVAAQVGFSEASTFHRAFKQWTGVAPGEYRLVHGSAER